MCSGQAPRRGPARPGASPQLRTCVWVGSRLPGAGFLSLCVRGCAVRLLIPHDVGMRHDSRPDGPEVKPAGRQPAPRRGTRNRARQPPGPEGPTGRGQTPAEVAGDRSPTPCKDTAAPRTLRSSLPAPSGSSETEGRARARSPPPRGLPPTEGTTLCPERCSSSPRWPWPQRRSLPDAVLPGARDPPCPGAGLQSPRGGWGAPVPRRHLSWQPRRGPGT